MDTRKAKGGHPLNWLASAGDNFRTLREPALNVVGVAEQVTDTLNCDLGQILCGFIELTIGFIETFILKLSLNLFTGADKCDTIHRGHDSLLNNFSGNITLEAFSDLNERRVSFVFNFSDNQF